MMLRIVIVPVAPDLGSGPINPAPSVHTESPDTCAMYFGDSATTLDHATLDTYDYLVNLRAQMGDYIDDGSDIIDSVNVEQSAWEYLTQFEQLAKCNAQQVYSEMEWK